MDNLNGKAGRWLSQLLERAKFEEECIEWPFADNGNGYGKIKSQYTHRVVCEHFHGAPPEGTQAAHSCGNRICCNPKHLRWLTPLENTREKVGHGTQQMGETTPFSVLTEQDVKEIINSKKRECELARAYGVAQTTINGILAGKKWKHITKGVDRRRGRARGVNVSKAKLTPELALKIYRDDRTQKKIGMDYGIHPVTVSKIKTGKTWVHVTNHS